jgi:hypothetical protein
MVSENGTTNGDNNHHRNERTPCMVSVQKKSKQTLSKVIQQYKASVTRETKTKDIWHTRFHDHIIRNDADYRRIWLYIDENPLKWTEDCYYENQ